MAASPRKNLPLKGGKGWVKTQSVRGQHSTQSVEREYKHPVSFRTTGVLGTLAPRLSDRTPGVSTTRKDMMTTNLGQSQLFLPGFSSETIPEHQKMNSEQNKLSPEDRRFHDWYRFVLSFPPHLVRDYLDDFRLHETHTVLDPFCGTGTTLVESKLQGIKSVGLEVNPFVRFASSVKVDWSVNPDILEARSQEIAKAAFDTLKKQGIDDNFLFTGNIEQLPLHTLAPEATKLLLKTLSAHCRYIKSWCYWIV